jgi:hypothetical protein
MIQPTYVTAFRSQRVWGVVAICGLIALAASSAVAPERAWANGLLMAYYLVTLGLGAAVFLALTSVTGAGWHVAIRRIPEALTSLLPAGGILIVALVAMESSRFTWQHHGSGDAGSFWFKEMWLSAGFHLARTVVFLLLWILFAALLVRASRRQDQAAVHPRRIHPALSVVFLFLFAPSFSLAAIDWIMALEPMWFSTMWGVYQFSGLVMGVLAVMIIAGILLRRAGPMQGLFRDEHLHDLAKLLLGFSCFWMYIWFCQYMLIWYSNIPEETSYFVKRLQGAWGPMIVAALILNWGIPFLTLLPRPHKRDEAIMLRVAVVVLVGRWVDLSVMIFPPVIGDAPPLGIPEAAAVVSGCGLSVVLFRRAFASAGRAPLNDPFLGESLHYHA